MREMREFAILAPDLDKPGERLLRALIVRGGLVWSEPIMELSDARNPESALVLSVGKAGLDAWHEWGLVQANRDHGKMFEYRDALGYRFDIMQIQHPGLAMQRTLPGFTAKQDIGEDLNVWVGVLMGLVEPEHLRMTRCGRCKEGERWRKAEYWWEGVDGAGLCEDHWRGRGRIVKKEKPRPKKGTVEAQIEGQMEMMEMLG